MKSAGSMSALLLVPLLACGGDKKDPATAPAKDPAPTAPTPTKRPAPGPTGPPRPQPTLTVTLDGQPVTMATALAWPSWDGTIKVTASSVPVSCADVTGASRRLYPGEVTFEVSAAAGLQPDGARRGEVRSTYFEGMTTQHAAPTNLVGDGAPDQPTSLDVDFTTTSVAMGGRPAQQLVVKGAIDALGCVVAPRDGAPPAPAPTPMAATIEVAGVKRPITFAKYETLGAFRNLELYTGAEGCTPVPFQRPGELTVRLTWFTADDPTVGQVTLDGILVSNRADQRYDKKKITVTPTPTGPGAYDLRANIVVMDYPVKLAGKVSAVDCK